ncbi:MAG: hypothetical protein R3F55_15780 [Alphaproteobacteria bacterium]
MSFTMSWVAFKGMSADDACAAFGAERTGEMAPAESADLMGLELPGWYLILVDDRGAYDLAAHDFAQSQTLPTELLEFHIVENAGHARLESYASGEQRWSIWYDSNQKPALQLQGDLPPELAEVRARLEARRQREAPKSKSGAYDSDLPAEIGKALTGFRHDDVDDSTMAEVLRMLSQAGPTEAADDASEGAPSSAGATAAGQTQPAAPRPSQPPAPSPAVAGRARPWWKFW